MCVAGRKEICQRTSKYWIVDAINSLKEGLRIQWL